MMKQRITKYIVAVLLGMLLLPNATHPVWWEPGDDPTRAELSAISAQLSKSRLRSIVVTVAGTGVVALICWVAWKKLQQYSQQGMSGLRSGAKGFSQQK